MGLFAILSRMASGLNQEQSWCQWYKLKSLVKSAFVKQLIAVFSHCWPKLTISGETSPFGLTF